MLPGLVCTRASGPPPRRCGAAAASAAILASRHAAGCPSPWLHGTHLGDQGQPRAQVIKPDGCGVNAVNHDAPVAGLHCRRQGGAVQGRRGGHTPQGLGQRLERPWAPG